jgi:hypothetical protein
VIINTDLRVFVPYNYLHLLPFKGIITQITVFKLMETLFSYNEFSPNKDFHDILAVRKMINVETFVTKRPYSL